MPKLHMMMLIMSLAVLFGADQAMARDDGGFGSSHFTAKAPSALSDAPTNGMIAQQIKLEVSPADTEPAAGEEEDVTPDSEPINGDAIMQKPEQTDSHIIIQNEMTVR